MKQHALWEIRIILRIAFFLVFVNVNFIYTCSKIYLTLLLSLGLTIVIYILISLWYYKNEHIRVWFIKKVNLKIGKTIEMDVSKWICLGYVRILRAKNFQFFFNCRVSLLISQAWSFLSGATPLNWFESRFIGSASNDLPNSFCLDMYNGMSDVCSGNRILS